LTFCWSYQLVYSSVMRSFQQTCPPTISSHWFGIFMRESV
jgi:hypothetical protein